jgi:hypothetical protein
MASSMSCLSEDLPAAGVAFGLGISSFGVTLKARGAISSTAATTAALNSSRLSRVSN